MTISGDAIRPGDVYEYRCGNDQGYGYMVPVKTSSGWDFIDTYHLDIPWKKDGETKDRASIRRIIELGHGEHDGYVRRATSEFYHHNARLGRAEVPHGLRLAFNLSDYDVASRRECDDYDSDDVIVYVPLYREQHFDWHSGRTLGLCFVRKGAKKSTSHEFRSLIADAYSSIVYPCIGIADTKLDEAKEKLRELEGVGLSTQMDKDDLSRLAKRIGAIDECVGKLREIDREYEKHQFRYTGSTDEEDNDDD
jgi:hypothetical protein